jgi:hypothetical protein
MTARLLIAAGACFGVAAGANAQLQDSASAAQSGNAYVGPAGTDIYNNAYDGASTFGNAFQVFEAAFSGYDIWLGDDFSADANYDSIEMATVAFCGNGCVDPFLVQDFYGRIYDALPNDANANLVAESDSFSFNGIDTWTATFEDDCLPAGDYFFAVAARNDFGTNGQTYAFQQNTQVPNDGFQWNPGGAFGFPGNLQFITDQDGVTPGSPNMVITGSEVDQCDGAGCPGDCDGNGVLNILDFVCFQGEFQNQSPFGDCDGNGLYNILDFVCFQGDFQQGCP